MVVLIPWLWALLHKGRPKMRYADNGQTYPKQRLLEKRGRVFMVSKGEKLVSCNCSPGCESGIEVALMV